MTESSPGQRAACVRKSIVFCLFRPGNTLAFAPMKKICLAGIVRLTENFMNVRPPLNRRLLPPREFLQAHWMVCWRIFQEMYSAPASNWMFSKSMALWTLCQMLFSFTNSSSFAGMETQCESIFSNCGMPFLSPISRPSRAKAIHLRRPSMQSMNFCTESELLDSISE